MIVPPGDESHLRDRLPAPLVMLVPVDTFDHHRQSVDEQLPLRDPHVPEADLRAHMSRAIAARSTVEIVQGKYQVESPVGPGWR